MEVYNPTKSYESRTLKVTLDSPQALTADDFKVAVKRYSEGAYVNERSIDDVYTTDNKTYEVYLNGYYIDSGEYVRVTVDALNGQKTAETQFLVDRETVRDVYTAKLGQDKDKEYINDAANGWSKAAIKSGNLPAGLKLLNLEGASYVAGDATAVTDNQHVIFEVTDELGKISTTDMNFLIGDDDHIIVENATIGDQVSGKIYAGVKDDYDETLYAYLHFAGGKGDKKVELLNSYNDIFEVSSDYDDDIYIRADRTKLTAGTYNVPVKVTDEQGKTGQGTLTVIVSASAKVTTKVNNVNSYYANVYFYNHDLNEEISLGSMTTEEPKDISDTVKEYTGYLPQGTYSVYYRMAGRKVLLNKTMTINGDTNLEVTVPTTKAELKFEVLVCKIKF